MDHAFYAPGSNHAETMGCVLYCIFSRMKWLKKLLLVLLGEKRYLRLLSVSFQQAFRLHLVGKNYQDIYFLKKWLKTGDICADIGAHLGYYSFEMSRLVGNAGRVIAIEPMLKFYNTLCLSVKKQGLKNIEVKKLAMGGKTDEVEMGIPRIRNMKKFAYARVVESSEHLVFAETEKVKNVSGDDLFFMLDRLDFIKCDVEGLELPLFRSMIKTLEKHTPVLLCELADKKDRVAMYEMLEPLGYHCYLLFDGKMHLLDVYSNRQAVSHNHYFFTQKHAKTFAGLIAQQ